MMNSEAASPAKKAAKCNLSDPTSAERENKTEKNIVFSPGNKRHIAKKMPCFLLGSVQDVSSSYASISFILSFYK